jgi:hypothetical protein
MSTGHFSHIASILNNFSCGVIRKQLPENEIPIKIHEKQSRYDKGKHDLHMIFHSSLIQKACTA